MNEPRPTVAIIGASGKPNRYSYKSYKAHAACGYEVYLVNPRGGEIEDRRVYATIDEIPPTNLNRVTMYVSPAIGGTLLEAIARKGCEELWFNPGSESDELVERARALGLNPVVACSLVDCQSRPQRD
ncbi:CoA-binding protein [Botrimarina hoheduenensis]|uniref:CoA-binding domain-containing protein n=1 Tax=Botrimarina hoheduenensis TaxID=2528000 RepID=A0A5C5W902_9BACT|nr:CoA-binding protein [Botrimarina hoheduenensis]TWT46509.1 hypothetical protein Pla111_16050 [Botrimarina hoheduenensis]